MGEYRRDTVMCCEIGMDNLALLCVWEHISAQMVSMLSV